MAKRLTGFLLLSLSLTFTYLIGGQELREEDTLSSISDQCCGQEWTKLVLTRHDDRAPGLHGSAVTLNTEVYSPANIQFVMPAFPFDRQLNCASIWETGKMDFIVNVGPTLIKETGYGDELQLMGKSAEPTRCVISFAQVVTFEAKSVVKKKRLR